MEFLSGKSLIRANGTTVSADEALVNKKVILFYFSAHWCPPCRAFTPLLKDFYDEVDDSAGVEIIFVSSDRSHEDLLHYMNESHGDWLAVQHGSEEGHSLKQKYSISGIPSLIVVRKSDGSLITKDGRGQVQSKGPAAVRDWN